MKNTLALILLLLSASALADTPPPGAVKIKGGTDGTLQGNVGDSSKVNVTNPISATVSSSLGAPVFTQTVVSGGLIDPRDIRALVFGSDSVTAYQGGAPWSFGLPTGASTSALQATGNASLASILSALQGPLAVTGTFWQATQPVSIASSVAVTGPITDAQLRASAVPVSASALPLPSGAATSANQSTQITAEQATQASAASIDGKISTTANGVKVDVQSSALPTGAASAANQTNGSQVTQVSSLPATPAGSNLIGKVGIDQTTPGTTNGVQVNAALPAGTNSIGTVVQTALATGSISNNAAITTGASTFTAPANAIGFIIEAESGNTDNIRWAVGSTATSSVGMLAEPGRDSGYIPLAANISVIAISGTQSASVQWVVR